MDAFSFLLETDKLSGTYIEHRIDNIINTGDKGHQLYKPRSGAFNRSLGKYSDD